MLIPSGRRLEQLSFGEYIAHAWATLCTLPESGHRIREASLEWDIPPWPDREYWGVSAKQMAGYGAPAPLRSKSDQPAQPSGDSASVS